MNIIFVAVFVVVVVGGGCGGVVTFWVVSKKSYHAQKYKNKRTKRKIRNSMQKYRELAVNWIIWSEWKRREKLNRDNKRKVNHSEHRTYKYVKPFPCFNEFAQELKCIHTRTLTSHTLFFSTLESIAMVLRSHK